jgi:hypothetical protein
MYSVITGPAGTQPLNDWYAPDTTQRHALGVVATGVDPYWGYGEFMYVKSNDAILKGSVCVVGLAPTYLATLVPNTANQGFPVGVAIAPMASGTFGWLQVSGATVYKTNATVAADAAIGITAAGILGTNAAGKQILNCRNVRSATATVTVTAQTVTGSYVLNTQGYDGFFLGAALTGTGVPASTVVAKLDPDGNRIYMGSAIGTVGDKIATATGSITLTGTYTGFGSGMISRPFAQGAIT